MRLGEEQNSPRTKNSFDIFFLPTSIARVESVAPAFLSVITSYLSRKDNNKFMFILLRWSFSFEHNLQLNACCPLSEEGQVRVSLTYRYVMFTPLYLMINCCDFLHKHLLHAASRYDANRWINNFYCYCFLTRDAVNQAMDWFRLQGKWKCWLI